MIKSKIMIVGIILVAVFVLLLAFGRKSVHAEISIEATPNQIWSALTETSKIKDWNTVLIPVDGELREGSKVTYQFFQDEGGKAATMSARVEKMNPEKLINQKGGIPMILTFDHRYIIEATSDGTKVTIHEEYRGAMVPFWNPTPVGTAYERLLKQLKKEIE